MLPANANATASQLFHVISSFDVIPNHISVQLDNCAVNKNYTVFGAFGLLLKWVPQLCKIYICTNEVGHTHNDVDQLFGVLSRAMDQKEVYSPQGHLKFAEEKLQAVVGNHLVPATYDFYNLVYPLCKDSLAGQINSNHFFELSKNDEGKVIVKIARFIRSQQFVIKDAKSEVPTSFPLFNIEPDLEKYPALIQQPPFDVEKHAKLCSAVRGTIPEAGYEELLNLPALIDGQVSEDFTVLLKRIRDNVITPAAKTASLLPDPDNEQLDAFKKSGVIDKVWAAPNSIPLPSTKPLTATALERGCTQTPSASAPVAKKKKMNEPSISTQNAVPKFVSTVTRKSNTVPMKSKPKRGRPPKNDK
uniref:Uncharacterized protein n=1 Tax=Panagrolaimus sp. PS1159 TaxID=55785 RepID=A0AC35FXV8_9BILA